MSACGRGALRRLRVTLACLPALVCAGQTALGDTRPPEDRAADMVRQALAIEQSALGLPEGERRRAALKDACGLLEESLTLYPSVEFEGHLANCYLLASRFGDAKRQYERMRAKAEQQSATEMIKHIDLSLRYIRDNQPYIVINVSEAMEEAVSSAEVDGKPIALRKRTEVDPRKTTIVVKTITGRSLLDMEITPKRRTTLPITIATKPGVDAGGAARARSLKQRAGELAALPREGSVEADCEKVAAFGAEYASLPPELRADSLDVALPAASARCDSIPDKGRFDRAVALFSSGRCEAIEQAIALHDAYRWRLSYLSRCALSLASAQRHIARAMEGARQAGDAAAVREVDARKEALRKSTSLMYVTWPEHAAASLEVIRDDQRVPVGALDRKLAAEGLLLEAGLYRVIASAAEKRWYRMVELKGQGDVVRVAVPPSLTTPPRPQGQPIPPLPAPDGSRRGGRAPEGVRTGFVIAGSSLGAGALGLGGAALVLSNTGVEEDRLAGKLAWTALGCGLGSLGMFAVVVALGSGAPGSVTSAPRAVRVGVAAPPLPARAAPPLGLFVSTTW